MQYTSKKKQDLPAHQTHQKVFQCAFCLESVALHKKVAEMGFAVEEKQSRSLKDKKDGGNLESLEWASEQFSLSLSLRFLVKIRFHAHLSSAKTSTEWREKSLKKRRKRM